MRTLGVTIVMALILAACGGGDTGEETKPTVPEGTARLRLVLHHHQSDKALDALVNTLGQGDLRS